MDSSSNDPLGLLERNRTLRDLFYLRGVETAVREGRPHDLYEVLLEARRTGAAEAHRIDQLLGDPQLFLEPIVEAPALFTTNLIGWGLVGLSDLRDDGSYVAGYFMKLLHLPVFPHGRYLVRTQETKERKHYVFLGKLPLTPVLRWWRRLIGLGVAAGVAAAIFGIHAASSTMDVRILNGLDIPVEVSIGDRVKRVEPGRMEILEAETGEQEIVARRVDGEVVEQLREEIQSFRGLVAYNVLGSAPLYAEEIIYSDKPVEEENEFVFYGGTSFVSLMKEQVHYLFQDPPATIQIGRSGRGVRRSVNSWKIGWRETARYLALREKTGKEAVELLRRVIRAQPDDTEAIYDSLRILYAARSTKPLDLELAEGVVADRADSVEAHRVLQQVRISRGERVQLLESYRARFDNALRALALAGSGRAVEAIRLVDQRGVGSSVDFEAAVAFARLVQLVGDSAGRPPDYHLWQMFHGEDPPPGLRAQLAVAAGLEADGAIDALEGEGEKAARRLELMLLEDPGAAFRMARQAGEEVMPHLQEHSLLLLLGPAAKADDRELLQAIEARLSWLFGPCLDYVRTGREMPDLDQFRPDQRAVLDVARAYLLAGEKRGPLLASAIEADPLHGPAYRAAQQWFSTSNRKR